MIIRFNLILLATLFHAPSLWAMPIDFQFSFSDAVNGTNVTGIIRGLEDNLSDQAAASVEVLTSTGGFGVGDYVGSPARNRWSVAAGAITEYEFTSYGYFNNPPAVECCTLAMHNGAIFPHPGYGLSSRNDGASLASGLVTFDAVHAVPTPATEVLFCLGLAGLALSHRRRRKLADVH